MSEELSVGENQIGYDLAGEGPLVVLAHGIGDTGHTYRFLVPALVAAGYRVADVDMRGCGESSPVGTGPPAPTSRGIPRRSSVRSAGRPSSSARNELTDTVRDATQGRAGTEALAAAAQAMRRYVKQHPGRHAAGNAVHPDGPDDPLVPAAGRLFTSLSAVLRGYRLDSDQEIHALRALRSMPHGFATLEVPDGFPYDTDIDASFRWMLGLMDDGLRVERSSP